MSLSRQRREVFSSRQENKKQGVGSEFIPPAAGSLLIPTSENTKNMYFVYILQSCKDDGYYVGFTSDLKKRLAYHNSGKQQSTRKRMPFKLVYFEEIPDKQAAVNREKQIKSYKGGTAFKRLLGLE